MRLAVCRLRRRLPRDSAAGFTCQVIPVALHMLFFSLTPTEPLFLFPSVLYGTLVVSREFLRPFSGYYVFNALLLVLQALHIFWAYLILRMVYKFVFMGKVRRLPSEGQMNQGSHSLWLSFPQVERDERSDEESEAEDEPDEEGEECRREHRKGGINSKLTSLANNCMLNNLTNQRNINSRLPKAR